MEATQPPEAARSEGVPTAIVLDTSASMLGKSSEGTTLFDIARFAATQLMLSQAVKECAVFTSKMPPSHVIYPASKVLPFVFNTLNAIVPGDGSEITTTVRNALSYWNRWLTSAMGESFGWSMAPATYSTLFVFTDVQGESGLATRVWSEGPQATQGTVAHRDALAPPSYFDPNSMVGTGCRATLGALHPAQRVYIFVITPSNTTSGEASVTLKPSQLWGKEEEQSPLEWIQRQLAETSSSAAKRKSRSPLDGLCRAMGGRAWRVSSLNGTLEKLRSATEHGLRGVRPTAFAHFGMLRPVTDLQPPRPAAPQFSVEPSIPLMARCITNPSVRWPLPESYFLRQKPMFLPRPSRVPLLVDPFQQAHDIRDGLCSLVSLEFPCEIYEIKGKNQMVELLRTMTANRRKKHVIFGGASTPSTQGGSGGGAAAKKRPSFLSSLSWPVYLGRSPHGDIRNVSLNSRVAFEAEPIGFVVMSADVLATGLCKRHRVTRSSFPTKDAQGSATSGPPSGPTSPGSGSPKSPAIERLQQTGERKQGEQAAGGASEGAAAKQTDASAKWFSLLVVLPYNYRELFRILVELATRAGVVPRAPSAPPPPDSGKQPFNISKPIAKNVDLSSGLTPELKEALVTYIQRMPFYQRPSLEIALEKYGLRQIVHDVAFSPSEYPWTEMIGPAPALSRERLQDSVAGQNTVAQTTQGKVQYAHYCKQRCRSLCSDAAEAASRVLAEEESSREKYEELKQPAAETPLEADGYTSASEAFDSDAESVVSMPTGPGLGQGITLMKGRGDGGGSTASVASAPGRLSGDSWWLSVLPPSKLRGGRRPKLRPSAIAAAADRRHAVPIEKMSDFRQAMARHTQLRDPLSLPDEGGMKRVLFGNPYVRKTAMKRVEGMKMVDETDALVKAVVDDDNENILMPSPSSDPSLNSAALSGEPFLEPEEDSSASSSGNSRNGNEEPLPSKRQKIEG